MGMELGLVRFELGSQVPGSECSAHESTHGRWAGVAFRRRLGPLYRRQAPHTGTAFAQKRQIVYYIGVAAQNCIVVYISNNPDRAEVVIRADLRVRPAAALADLLEEESGEAVRGGGTWL